MKKNKSIKLNSLLLGAVFVINSSITIAPSFAREQQRLNTEDTEKVATLCGNFLTYPPTEKTNHMLELAELLNTRHGGKDLEDLNADIKQEEKEILKYYQSGYEYIGLEGYRAGTFGNSSNDTSSPSYYYNYAGKKNNNLFNGLTTQKDQNDTIFDINTDLSTNLDVSINLDADTISHFQNEHNASEKRRNYVNSRSIYQKERELLDKISNQYLINNKDKQLNTSWVNFAKQNQNKVNSALNASTPEKREELQRDLLNECKKKLAFDFATNIEDKSSGEEYKQVLKNYEKLFGNKKADEPNSLRTNSPTCVEGEDSNMMLIDSKGRRISCDELSDSPLKESNNWGGILSLMSLPSQEILKSYGTQDYCEKCLKNKFNFYSKFNNKLSKNNKSAKDKNTQNREWNNKVKEANKKLNKELQLKAISNSILKLSDLSEQYQHTLAWMDEKSQEEFQRNQKPCLTEESFKKAINDNVACRNNENKLQNRDILDSISFSLGTKLDSFSSVEQEIQKIMKKSLKSHEGAQCKSLNRSDFVRKSAAVNFQTNATKGAEYIIDQMLVIANKDLEAYKKNNSNDSAMTPVQFLTNALSNEVLKDEVYKMDSLKRNDKTSHSTTPLTDFFRATRSGLSFTLQDVLKDIPQLSNFAKDRALTNSLATSQSDKPARNKIMIQASVTAYLSKVARTNPQMYFLLNDKEYFLDKAEKYKKSKTNAEFTDFISNNGNDGQHMKTLAEDYSKYQDNKCRVFMKEIAESACPSDGYHDRFSNKDKKLAANSLAKKEDSKRANNSFSRYWSKNKITDKEYYLRMIALESAACSQTLTDGLPIDKMKESPLLDIDYSIAPTSKSDYQDILKDKLGLGKVDRPRNKLNEFAESKFCDVDALDKVFENHAINPENPKTLESKEMDEITKAFYAEENRVNNYNKQIVGEVKEVYTSIDDSAINADVERSRENFSEESNIETEKIVYLTDVIIPPREDYSNGVTDLNQESLYNYEIKPIDEVLRSTWRKRTFQYNHNENKNDTRNELFKDIETNIAIGNKEIFDQAVANNEGLKAPVHINTSESENIPQIEGIASTTDESVYRANDNSSDSSNSSLLSSSVAQSLSSESLNDLRTGNMEDYNNRVSYQDPMYREMLNESSLQHPKNIEKEKVEYDEYLSQKEENPSELKSEVDKLMAEIEELKTKKNEDKLAQLKAQKKAIEQELLTAQEEKLESEIKQKSAQVAQAVAATNTSTNKSPIVKTNSTTNSSSSGQSYNAPVAPNAYNNTANYSNNTQPQVAKTTPSPSRAPASISRSGKNTAISSQNSTGFKKSIASNFNPIGILSSDGKTVDNGALDTYLTKIKEQDITDQSQLVHFENVNGTTIVKFSNSDGTNIEVDLSQIEDQDVLTELYQIQTNLEFSEKEIISVLEKQKKLVEKSDVIISEIVKTNEEKARLELLKEKLKLASQAYKAATN